MPERPLKLGISKIFKRSTAVSRFNEHAPPHFHVEYAEFKATVDIKSLALSRGDLPRRAQELVLDWAELHQQELLENWSLCVNKQQPNPIAPLK